VKREYSVIEVRKTCPKTFLISAINVIEKVVALRAHQRDDGELVNDG
jgi:hypothetical protein